MCAESIRIEDYELRERREDGVLLLTCLLPEGFRAEHDPLMVYACGSNCLCLEFGGVEPLVSMMDFPVNRAWPRERNCVSSPLALVVAMLHAEPPEASAEDEAEDPVASAGERVARIFHIHSDCLAAAD